jgi:hypothetical protein
MTDSTAGATIYYTTDGTTPTTSSMPYSAPITVSTTKTLKAIATAPGYSKSAVTSGAYIIAVPAPVFTPGGGTYTAAQSVTITDSMSGAAIYFTTDGTPPTTASRLYSGPITVSMTQTIKALAVNSGYSNSAVTTATYTIATATPVFSPKGGTYTSAQSVTIADSTPGAVIYYSTDGSTPTTSSKQYTGPITVSSSQTLKAIATASGHGTSSVAVAVYTISGA